jgi:hypothetical protein
VDLSRLLLGCSIIWNSVPMFGTDERTLAGERADDPAAG